MNEVENCLHYANWKETRKRILDSIIANKLTKPHCREIATQKLECDVLYKTKRYD